MAQTILMKKKVIRRLEILLHILTSVILLLKGFDQFTKTIYFPAVILISLGLLVMLLNLFWRKLKVKPKEARTACYYIETPALLLISYIIHLEGVHTVPYAFFIASLLYAAVGFISSKKSKKINRQHF